MMCVRVSASCIKVPWMGEAGPGDETTHTTTTPRAHTLTHSCTHSLTSLSNSREEGPQLAGWVEARPRGHSERGPTAGTVPRWWRGSERHCPPPGQRHHRERTVDRKESRERMSDQDDSNVRAVNEAEVDRRYRGTTDGCALGVQRGQRGRRACMHPSGSSPAHPWRAPIETDKYRKV